MIEKNELKMKTNMPRKSLRTLLPVLLCLAAPANADLKRTGDWPKDERPVALDWEGDREGAVQELAKKAGWNLIVSERTSEAKERPAPASNERVRLHVKDLSPTQILDAIYDGVDRSYEAKRTGTLVRVSEIRREATQTVPVIPSVDLPSAQQQAVPPNVVSPAVVPTNVAPPALPAIPHVPGVIAKDHVEDADDSGEGTDRSVAGSSLVIAKGERAHDVSVMGGNVEIFGTVTGDLVVFGGRAIVREGGHIQGDALAVGGKIQIERGGRIDGDTNVIGGAITKDEGAIVRGKSHKASKGEKVVSHALNDEDHVEDRRSFAERASDSIGHVFSLFSLFFVFGSIVIASRRGTMEQLRAVAGINPLRNLGVGIVAGIAAMVAVAISAVTVVGIPLAVVGSVVGALLLYVGVVAVLGLVGELLLRQRTKNEFVHLAVGAALFAIVTQVPVVGTWVGFATAAMGIGVLVTARANATSKGGFGSTDRGAAYRG